MRNFCLICLACFFYLDIWGQATAGQVNYNGITPNFGSIATALVFTANATTTIYDVESDAVEHNISGGASAVPLPANLGSFDYWGGQLKFQGGEVKTWRDDNVNVCQPKLYYRVYPAGSPAGTYAIKELAYKDKCINSGGLKFELNPQAPCYDDNGSFPDHRWSVYVPAGTEDGFFNIDLTQRCPGDYTIEMYFNVIGSNSNSGCNDSIQIVMTDLTPFKADFTINPLPVPTLSVASITCDASTLGSDTYTAVVDYDQTPGPTNGNLSPYWESADITTTSGSIAIDIDPNTNATGTFTVTGLTEGAGTTVKMKNKCTKIEYATMVTSPTCSPVASTATFTAEVACKDNTSASDKKNDIKITNIVYSGSSSLDFKIGATTIGTVPSGTTTTTFVDVDVTSFLGSVAKIDVYEGATLLSSVEVFPVVCGYTTTSNVFCDDQNGTTGPGILAQVPPSAQTSPKTQDARYVYVLTDNSDKVVAVNNTGLFGSVSNATYKVYLYTVEKSEEATLEAQFVVGSPIPATVTGCASACANTTITVNCCEAEAGELTNADVSACEGDATLNMTITTGPDGANAINTTAEYAYVYLLVNDADGKIVLASSSTALNLTSVNPLADTAYTLYGLNYKIADMTAGNIKDGAKTISAIADFVGSTIVAILESQSPNYTVGEFCGDLTTNTVKIAIKHKPIAPTSPNLSYCLNDVATQLSATGEAGATFTWYNVDPSTPPVPSLASAPTPVTTAIGTTDYWVTQTVGGCESDATIVTITVTDKPSGDATTTAVCVGDDIVLNFTATPSTTVYYHFGTTNKSFVTPAGGTQSETLLLADYTSSITSNTLVVTIDSVVNTSTGCKIIYTGKTVTTNIDQLPTLVLEADKTACSTKTTEDITGTVTNVDAATIMWIGGAGSFAPSSGNISTTYTYAAADKTADMITLTATANGTGACSSKVVTDDVIIDILNITCPTGFPWSGN